MKIHGVTVPESALTAGRAAMRGEFTTWKIEAVLRLHLDGVRFPSGWNSISFVSEAANRLLQSERRAGRITYQRGRTWRVN